MKSLSSLIKARKFDWVDHEITALNFPPQPIRSSEYKLFHFNRDISPEDAVKEIEKEGYLPATIYELLAWKDWNESGYVIALGSVKVRDEIKSNYGIK